MLMHTQRNAQIINICNSWVPVCDVSCMCGHPKNWGTKGRWSQGVHNSGVSVPRVAYGSCACLQLMSFCLAFRFSKSCFWFCLYTQSVQWVHWTDRATPNETSQLRKSQRYVVFVFLIFSLFFIFVVYLLIDWFLVCFLWSFVDFDSLKWHYCVWGHQAETYKCE
jgi:hypothetical protein